MTKQQLSHHMELRKQFTEQQELLASLEAAGLADEAAGIRENIANLGAEVQQSETAVATWIDTVEDTPAHIIFRLRFIHCMTWSQVAKAIGGRNTANSVKLICYRYLNAHHDE